MKWMAVAAIVVPLAVFGCGGDDDGGGNSVQDELADLLVEDTAIDVDPECIRGKTSELSDDQAQFLIDNIDAESTEGFDAALQVWGDALTECIVVPEESGDRGRFNDEADGVHAVVADCFVREASDGTHHYSTTIEIDNGSDAARLVTVTVESDTGWSGVSDTFEVPAGGRDAWGVTSDEATTDEVGDVECADYISGIVVTVESP